MSIGDAVGDAIAWSIETTMTTSRYDMLGWAITAQVIWWGIQVIFGED